MKNILLGGLMALFATTAMASDFSVLGEVEYAIEAETFVVESGLEYTRNDFRVTTLGKFTDTNYTGAEVEVGYTINDSLEAYFRVEADKDFNYSEAVVGTSFRF